MPAQFVSSMSHELRTPLNAPCVCGRVRGKFAVELGEQRHAVGEAKRGLVASHNRPGGNATGVNFLVTELGSKQLGLLHELVPTAARVGLLVNPKFQTPERAIRDVTAAASAIGLQVDVVQASDSREIESVFR